MIAAGVIRTNTKWPFEKRLLEIASGLRAPDPASMRPKRPRSKKFSIRANVKTALKLAHVRGVALLAIAEAGMELAEYSPLEVKTSVVGYGRAEKSQVQLMVRSLLGLAEPIESEDAADALAVAICHATHEATSRRLV